jgi:hypothetical protein
MSQYVPKEHLWNQFPGGLLEFEYDHDVYWPALTKLSAERRAARKKRWEAGGRHIGELEDYLNGHIEQGVAATAVPTETKSTTEAAHEASPKNVEANDGVEGVTDGVSKVAIEAESKPESRDEVALSATEATPSTAPVKDAKQEAA